MDLSYQIQELKDITYFWTQLLQARIELEGMIAENQHAAACGNNIQYREEAFLKLIETHGIHHNAVLTALQSRR